MRLSPPFYSTFVQMDDMKKIRTYYLNRIALLHSKVQLYYLLKTIADDVPYASDALANKLDFLFEEESASFSKSVAELKEEEGKLYLKYPLEIHTVNYIEDCSMDVLSMQTKDIRKLLNETENTYYLKKDSGINLRKRYINRERMAEYRNARYKRRWRPSFHIRD